MQWEEKWRTKIRVKNILDVELSREDLLKDPPE
jgi:hypothetical protein